PFPTRRSSDRRAHGQVDIDRAHMADPFDLRLAEVVCRVEGQLRVDILEKFDDHQSLGEITLPHLQYRDLAHGADGEEVLGLGGRREHLREIQALFKEYELYHIVVIAHWRPVKLEHD